MLVLRETLDLTILYHQSIFRWIVECYRVLQVVAGCDRVLQGVVRDTTGESVLTTSSSHCAPGCCIGLHVLQSQCCRPGVAVFCSVFKLQCVTKYANLTDDRVLEGIQWLVEYTISHRMSLMLKPIDDKSALDVAAAALIYCLFNAIIADGY